MFVTVVMHVVCWLFMRIQSADTSQSEIYRHENFGASCDDAIVFDTSVSASSRIGCAAACQQAGCAFFQYENGVCNMAQMGTMPIGSGITNDLYVRAVIPSSLTEQALDVIGKPAFSDTPWNKPIALDAQLAVDGSIEYPSYFHTYPSIKNAWWVLDLEAEYTVSEVEVLPNSAHLAYFKSMEIRVGETFNSTEYLLSKDFSSWKLLGFYEGPVATHDPVIFSCSHGAVGRYISIQRLNTGSKPYFAISEVKVKIYVMP